MQAGCYQQVQQVKQVQQVQFVCLGILGTIKLRIWSAHVFEFMNVFGRSQAASSCFHTTVPGLQAGPVFHSVWTMSLGRLQAVEIMNMNSIRCLAQSGLLSVQYLQPVFSWTQHFC